MLPMDKTDLQILEILQKKARIPNVEVARTIGMAPSAVLERIKKLEASGVIQGYEVRLNPDMFQCAMVAFVEVIVADPACFRKSARPCLPSIRSRKFIIWPGRTA